MTKLARVPAGAAVALLLMAAASPPSPSSRGPSPPEGALLEYLGTFETTKGGALDPLALEELPAAKERDRAPQPRKPVKHRRNTDKKEDRDDTT